MTKTIRAPVGLAAAIFCFAFIALANPNRECLTILTSPTTATDIRAVTNKIRGYIEEVVFDMPSGTGNVLLVTLPYVATEEARTIAATNTITADKALYPRWRADDPAGTGPLGSEYPIRLLLVDEQVVFSVTNASVTNATWKCLIKFDDGK